MSKYNVNKRHVYLFLFFFLYSSLADLGAQVQRLLRDKLERDLGRPVERGISNANKKSPAGGGSVVVPEKNIVPQDPVSDQVPRCCTII